MKPLIEKVINNKMFINKLDLVDVKQDLARLKKEWRAKCRRMKIMSGEVAIFEFER